MIARLLLALLALQALAVALLWYVAVHSWHIVQCDVALVLACALVLLLRLLITTNHFILSWWHGSATPDRLRSPPLQACRMFVEEWLANLHSSSWDMLRPGPALRLAPDARGLPVLLIHGYTCNGGFWAPLSERLRQAGISHAAISLEPVAGAIDDYVPLVQQAVAELRRASGSEQVVIVAHSMGGLVARAWLRQFGPAQVARIVTLGTPHHGTVLASFGPGANARQMCRQGRGEHGAPNTWLASLASMEGQAERAVITSIFSHHDNIVAPQTSAFLPGAKNIELAGLGHVSLARNGRALDCVMAEIDAANAAHSKD